MELISIILIGFFYDVCPAALEGQICFTQETIVNTADGSYYQQLTCSRDSGRCLIDKSAIIE